MNVRTRLTLLFALMVASIMLLFSLLIYYMYNQFREQEFIDRLTDKARTTVRLLDDIGGMTQQLLHRIEHNDLTALYQSHVTIYSAKGVLYDSDTTPFPISQALLKQAHQGKGFQLRQDQTELIGIQHKSKHYGNLVVVASAVDRYGFSKLQKLQEILLITWLGSLFIVMLAGRLFAGDVLKPISDIINQVNAISATNIHARLRVGSHKDELAKLAVTFNAMLSRLEEAFISQKNFVSHASHELRTPLALMMGQVDLALMQPRSNPEYKIALEGVLEEVKKMNTLVNGLLELANANTTTISFQSVRIDELLGQARGLILQKKPDYQININYEQIPEYEEDLMLLGEQSLLRTAFQNLMENGCKYSPNHHVEVMLRSENGRIQLTFSDQGQGIPAEDLPHIFQPFYRSTGTAEVEGHGIGLALTHRIIMLHHGYIQAESVIGLGTSIRITLPTEYNKPTE